MGHKREERKSVAGTESVRNGSEEKEGDGEGGKRRPWELKAGLAALKKERKGGREGGREGGRRKYGVGGKGAETEGVDEGVCGSR